MVPAPPGGSTNATSPTLRRSLSDLEGFLSPKTGNSGTTLQLPAATTIKNANGINIQQIGLSQSIEIFNNNKQQKTLSNVLQVQSGSHSLSGAIKLNALNNTMTLKSSSGDPKDSTLIELLKRGTRIAVTTKKPPMQTSTNFANSPQTQLNSLINITTANSSRQLLGSNNRAVLIPSSEMQLLSNHLKNADNSASSSRASTPQSTNVNLNESSSTPLSLSISQGNSEENSDNNTDVYTVTYASETGDFFEDSEVYNADMLLQTVDTMELLKTEIEDEEIENTLQHIKSEHSIEEYASAVNDNNNANVSNTLPTFQEFHTKELLIQDNSGQLQSVNSLRSSHVMSLPNMELKTSGSPLHSPLAYPTPPASHENLTHSSPFILEDAAQQFENGNNSFFGDKCSQDFLDQAQAEEFFKTSDSQDLSDDEKILKLKNALEESAFDAGIKVEDLLSGSPDDAECDLREFAETNLSFLDEDQEFLNNAHNANSPLSESFFNSALSSAEEVKEVLKEVLPVEENVALSNEAAAENIIDLYYLPGLGLQSQMMPNSEDPLLSSSPREFGQQRVQQQQSHQQIISQNQQQMQHLYNAAPIMQQQTQQPILQAQLENQTAQNHQTQQLQYEIENLTSNQQQNNFNNNTTTVAVSHQMSTLEAAMMQPIIYTGSTDKEEINISASSIGSSNNGNNSNNTLVQMLTNVSAANEIPMECNVFFSNQNTLISGNATMINTQSIPLTNTTQSLTLPVSTVISTLQPLSNQTNSILKRRLRGSSSNSSGENSIPHAYSKYHALSPFRSKLRKPSRTHYTPAPILNPDRKGEGLYSTVRKELCSGLIPFDDFEDNTGLVDFCDESKVNLGSAYQAQIPALLSREENASELNETAELAELLWNPNVQTDEKVLMRFIDLSKSSAVPLGSHSEEVALQTLLKADGNTSSAVLTLLQTHSHSFEMKWSAYDLEIFLRGLEKHGKDFARISKEVCSVLKLNKNYFKLYEYS